VVTISKGGPRDEQGIAQRADRQGDRSGSHRQVVKPPLVLENGKGYRGDGFGARASSDRARSVQHVDDRLPGIMSDPSYAPDRRDAATQIGNVGGQPQRHRGQDGSRAPGSRSRRAVGVRRVAREDTLAHWLETQRRPGIEASTQRADPVLRDFRRDAPARDSRRNARGHRRRVLERVRRRRTWKGSILVQQRGRAPSAQVERA